MSLSLPSGFKPNNFSSHTNLEDALYYLRMSGTRREHLRRAMLKGAEGLAYLALGVGGAAILLNEQNFYLTIAAIPALYLGIGPGLDAITESFEDFKYARDISRLLREERTNSNIITDLPKDQYGIF